MCHGCLAQPCMYGGQASVVTTPIRARVAARRRAWPLAPASGGRHRFAMLRRPMSRLSRRVLDLSKRITGQRKDQRTGEQEHGLRIFGPPAPVARPDRGFRLDTRSRELRNQKAGPGYPAMQPVTYCRVFPQCLQNRSPTSTSFPHSPHISASSEAASRSRASSYPQRWAASAICFL